MALALPTLLIAALCASPDPAAGPAIRYHRDERFVAFSARLDLPSFVVGEHRVVAVPRDDRAFLVYASYPRNAEELEEAHRRAEYEQSSLANAREDLERQQSMMKEADKAHRLALQTGKKTFSAPASWSGGQPTEKPMREWESYRGNLDRGIARDRERVAEGQTTLEKLRSEEQLARAPRLVGRLSGKGAAQIDLFVVPLHAALPASPTTTLTLEAPSGMVRAPDVLAEWADRQSGALLAQLVHHPEQAAFEQYAILRAHALYGGHEHGEVRSRRNDREIDLYSVMTGLASVQEALQLDAMQPRGHEKASQSTPLVSLAELEPPKLDSHDYEALRKGATPSIFEAANAVPAEDFALHFSSADAAFRVMDLLDDWGTDLAHAIEGSARDRGTKERLFTQLALPRNELTRFFASRAVESMTIVGHDPFVREGTDLSVIFTVKDSGLVRMALENARGASRKAHRDAKETEEVFNGVSLKTLASPDRDVSTTLAESGRFIVVGNSPAGVKACLDTIAGRAGSLAKAPDFRYLRTQFAGGEDAFAFLSDAFVRNVIGPRWKIGARRRIACAADLQMIEYGRLLARRDRQTALGLEALTKGGYVPGGLTCADGGHYTLDAQGAICSKHGRLSFLTPIVELPLQAVTAEEADEYRSFVQDYTHYWRQYIDPVGVRVKLGPPLEIETLVLPLVENSIYDGVRATYPSGPAKLLKQGETAKTIAAVSTALTPSKDIEHLLHELLPGVPDPWTWLGDEASLVIYDGDPLMTVGSSLSTEFLGRNGNPVVGMIVTGFLSSLTLPTALVVKVKDPVKARVALDELAMHLERESQGERGRFGFTSYRLDGAKAPIGVFSLSLFGVTFRLYHAFIGDQLYIASRRWLAEEAVARGSVAGPPASAEDDGHLRVRIEHGHLSNALAAIQAGWGESMRDACFRNLPDLSMIKESVGGDDPVAAVQGALSYRPYCPAGGHYLIEADGRAACSVHGRPGDPRQPRELSDATSTAHWLGQLSVIDMALTMTPEGLRARVRLEPAKK